MIAPPLRVSNQNRIEAITPGIRTKLKIGFSNEKYEQKADIMADHIVPKPLHFSSRPLSQSKSQIQRKCSARETDDEIMSKPIMMESDCKAPVPTRELSSRLSSSKGNGSPLSSATNHYMSRFFGIEFSHVRVHTGSKARKMNQGLNARAFTHGSDIYFNQGQYNPGSSKGKRLLGHELTHVVQQLGNAQYQVRLSSISPFDEELIQRLPFGRDDHFNERFGSNTFENDPFPDRASTLPYRQATELASCARIMGADSYEHCYQMVFGRHPNPAAARARALQAQRAQYLAGSCTHGASALTWSDFQATPPNSTFSAQTSFKFDLHSIGSQQVIRAIFRTNRSWVKLQFSNPSNRNLNGCTRSISQCQSHFDRITQAGQVGGTFNLGQPTGCAASIGPNPNITATSRAECSSVLGPECDRVSHLESQRLLRHEQYHYKLACELAQKGTIAILGGQDAGRILTNVRRNTNTQTHSYDSQTVHGCNQASQSTWEQAIDSGLPSVHIGNP